MEGSKNDYLNFPSSYYKNSLEEEDILQLAKNYQRQFQDIHPNKPTPPLVLENEFKVQKIICTTLCPFKTNKPLKLREWQDSATFVASFIEYDILEFPFKCPDELFSLDSTLKRRHGNSLDISMILTTLLLSSDYDAYTVQGYATKDVTENILRTRPSPPLPPKFSRLHQSKKKCKFENGVKNNKYNLNFSKEEHSWMEVEVPQEVRIESNKNEDSKVVGNIDKLFGKRVHFWILIRNLVENGKIEPFFVEPTTGKKISVNDADYLGIEFVWNNNNFWCNNHKFGKSCEGITFEFLDNNKWQAFLPENLLKSSEKGSFRIHMPETWLAGICISEKDIENKYPPRGKVIQYKTAKVHNYNPNTTEDGVVYKVVYYQTDEVQIPVQSHSLFHGRKDNLEHRSIDFKKKIVEECFSKGRKDALKKHQYNLNDDPSYLQVMTFYSHLRQDRLAKRSWDRSRSTYVYVDRPDFLNKRRVIYEANSVTDIEQSSSQQSENNGKVQTHLQNHESQSNSKQQEPEQNENNDLEANESSVEKTNEISISPSCFSNCEPILEGVDFSKWSFRDFFESIVPAERYATSESDSEISDDDSNIKEDIQTSNRNIKTENNLERNAIDMQNGENTTVSRNTSDVEQIKEDTVLGDISTSGKESCKNKTISTEDVVTITNVENISKEKLNEEGSTKDELPEEIEINIRNIDKNDLKENCNNRTSFVNEDKPKNELRIKEELVSNGNTKIEQNDEIVAEENFKNKEEKFEKNAMEENNPDKLGHEVNKTDELKMKEEKVSRDSTTNFEIVKNDDETEVQDYELLSNAANSDGDSETQDDFSEFGNRTEVEDQSEEEQDIYNELNFDALSDEELETDYQIYLSKLWKEYSDLTDSKLFYMQKTFEENKDMTNQKILQLKKKVIVKRRSNTQYLQRKEKGEPAVRVYKKKLKEKRDKGQYTNAFISKLDLKEKVSIDNVLDVNEFYTMQNLNEKFVIDADEEMIKNESMALLDRRLKETLTREKMHSGQHILSIKNSYIKDPSRLLENSIKNVWFLFETKTYRMDFHQPEDKFQSRTVVFTKPECESTGFKFMDYLCRQIVPNNETKKISRAQLYVYLISLMKEEALVLKETKDMEDEMKELLSKRIEEKKVDSDFKAVD
ncbi:hypothetical protein JTE90_024518 [Oedothorax gibbosus]|uniref:Uncharacterized protein n=1 Tax=Oedothorax gibbosus TaxID=931172 RepID=A0AAV6UMF6_9ARAC|nr:hypothetical protein JTE90_024518 [Oedothorax gibbosus]